MKLLKQALTLSIVSAMTMGTHAAAGTPSSKRVVDVSFSETMAPESDADRVKAYTTSEAVIRYADGHQEVYPLSYQPLFYSGQRSAGEIVDKEGLPIVESAADRRGLKATGPFYAY